MHRLLSDNRSIWCENKLYDANVHIAQISGVTFSLFRYLGIFEMKQTIVLFATFTYVFDTLSGLYFVSTSSDAIIISLLLETFSDFYLKILE